MIRVAYVEEIIDFPTVLDSDDQRHVDVNYLIPFGLRVGFRAGEFWSFYIGAGHNFGNLQLEGNPFLDSNDIVLKNNFFEAGLA